MRHHEQRARSVGAGTQPFLQKVPRCRLASGLSSEEVPNMDRLPPSDEPIVVSRPLVELPEGKCDGPNRT